MTAKQMFIARSTGTYINLLSYVQPNKAAVTAYRIFSSPLAGRFEENIPAFLEAVKHTSISLDGHRLQTYRWDGKLPTVMLVHGWESNAARWEPLLPHLLESGFGVVAVDAPGHGLSSGSELNLPFYADVISECIKLFNPSFLIGHSIGGAASLLSQHVSPASGLKKMVLLGAPSDMSIILNNFQNILRLSQRSRSLLRQYFVDRFGKGVEAYTASLQCRNISLPALVAHDLNDDVVLYDEAVKITRAWPHARLVTTRGLGHSMHDDGLYREVVNFLK